MSDLSAFHRVDDPHDYTAQWILPKVRALKAYKGAVRYRIEEEQEKQRNTPEGRAEASGGKVYTDPKKNIEAMQLGVFEAAAG